MIKFFMKRSLLVVLSLFLFFLVFFLLRDERGLRPKIFQKGDSFIEGLRVVYKKNGMSEWILTAKRADISEKDDKARLSDIKMTIEDKGITLYADKGLYHLTDGNLAVDGKIVAKGDTYSITSENGEFDHKSGIFKTDGIVRVESRRFSVLGKGMNIDSAEQKVKILRDVKATFNN